MKSFNGFKHFLICLFSVFITLVSCVNNLKNNTPEFVTFQFSAVVESILQYDAPKEFNLSGDIPYIDSIKFTVKNGDTLKGNLCYNLNSTSFFYQAGPVDLKYKLNDFTFQTTGCRTYDYEEMHIYANNNHITRNVKDLSTSISDILNISVCDSIAARQYSGFCVIRSEIIFTDSTASAFSESKLPNELHLEEFSESNMRIYAFKYIIPREGEGMWEINTRIIALKKI